MPKPIDLLTLEIARRKALSLDRYDMPAPISADSKKHLLSVAVEKTRMGQPLVQAWTWSRPGVCSGYFTPTRDVPDQADGFCGHWWSSELSAAVAFRNYAAQQFADKLIVFDAYVRAASARDAERAVVRQPADLRYVEPEPTVDESEIEDEPAVGLDLQIPPPADETPADETPSAPADETPSAPADETPSAPADVPATETVYKPKRDRKAERERRIARNQR